MPGTGRSVRAGWSSEAESRGGVALGAHIDMFHVKQAYVHPPFASVVVWPGVLRPGAVAWCCLLRIQCQWFCVSLSPDAGSVGAGCASAERFT